MARRPAETPARHPMPRIKHWLIAALIILATTTVAPFLAYLL